MNYEDRKLILFVADYLSFYTKLIPYVSGCFEAIYQRFETEQYIQELIAKEA